MKGRHPRCPLRRAVLYRPICTLCLLHGTVAFLLRQHLQTHYCLYFNLIPADCYYLQCPSGISIGLQPDGRHLSIFYHGAFGDCDLDYIFPI